MTQATTLTEAKQLRRAFKADPRGPLGGEVVSAGLGITGQQMRSRLGHGHGWHNKGVGDLVDIGEHRERVMHLARQVRDAIAKHEFV
jgi:hypothetical protein